MTENETTNVTGGETNGIADEITLPEGDAVAIMRDLRGCVNVTMLKNRLCHETGTHNLTSALETLADMVERDYVKRESIEGVMDTDRELVAENIRLTAERDEWKAKANCPHDYREGVSDGNPLIKKWTCSKCGHETFDIYKAFAEQAELRSNDGASNLEWLFENDSTFRAWTIRALRITGKQYAPVGKAGEWLMAPHVDAQQDTNETCPDGDETCPNHSKAQSKTEPSLSQLFGILSDDCGHSTDMSGKSADCVRSEPEMSEIDEPDTIRNDLEDNGYVVMPYHNGEKQAKLRGKEYDQVIFDELHDSREKLEADIWAGCEHLTTAGCGDLFVNVPWKRLLEWLDRQENITKRECGHDREALGDQHMALFNDAHRLECENRNLSMDLSECMEAKGALEDELRAVKRQLKQERGQHSVTLNNWEQAKGKLRRERESLQAWKASLDERDAKTAQEVADEQAAEYREKAEYWKRAAEEARAKLLSVREAVDGVKDAVDDVRGMV